MVEPCLVGFWQRRRRVLGEVDTERVILVAYLQRRPFLDIMTCLPGVHDYGQRFADRGLKLRLVGLLLRLGCLHSRVIEHAIGKLQRCGAGICLAGRRIEQRRHLTL